MPIRPHKPINPMNNIENLILLALQASPIQNFQKFRTYKEVGHWNIHWNSFWNRRNLRRLTFKPWNSRSLKTLTIYKSKFEIWLITTKTSKTKEYLPVTALFFLFASLSFPICFPLSLSLYAKRTHDTIRYKFYSLWVEDRTACIYPSLCFFEEIERWIANIFRTEVMGMTNAFNGPNGAWPALRIGIAGQAGPPP